MAGNSGTAGASVTSRALALLGAFDTDHRRLTLSELAQRADLPLPTAHRLVAEADAVIVALRARTLKGWGLDWEALHAVNPRLILLQVSGMGARSSQADAPGFGKVGEARSGPAGVQVALARQPDLVLMDVEMPGGDGITATRQIVAEAPHIRVLILTMFDLDDYVLTALRAGASGFLLKTTEPQALIRAVKEAAAGNTTLGPTVLARLVDSYVAQRPRQAAVP